MNVLYTVNAPLLPAFGVSFLSLLETNQEVEDLTIHFVGENLDKDAWQWMQRTANAHGRSIFYYELADLAPELVSCSALAIPIVPSRICVERIEALHRVIYLDGDTLVMGSLKPLWDMDMGDKLIWGVGTIIPDSHLFLIDNQFFPTRPERWFNNGVILMDVDALRDFGLMEKSFAIFDERARQSMRYHLSDENAVNHLFQGNLGWLPPKYNVVCHTFALTDQQIKQLGWAPDGYTQAEREEAIVHPVVIHYMETPYYRPYATGCFHPRLAIYESYAQRTFWGHQLSEPRRLRYLETVAQNFCTKRSRNAQGRMTGFWFAVFYVLMHVTRWLHSKRIGRALTRFMRRFLGKTC